MLAKLKKEKKLKHILKLKNWITLCSAEEESKKSQLKTAVNRKVQKKKKGKKSYDLKDLSVVADLRVNSAFPNFILTVVLHMLTRTSLNILAAFSKHHEKQCVELNIYGKV